MGVRLNKAYRAGYNRGYTGKPNFGYKKQKTEDDKFFYDLGFSRGEKAFERSLEK